MSTISLMRQKKTNHVRDSHIRVAHTRYAAPPGTNVKCLCVLKIPLCYMQIIAHINLRFLLSNPDASKTLVVVAFTLKWVCCVKECIDNTCDAKCQNATTSVAIKRQRWQRHSKPHRIIIVFFSLAFYPLSNKCYYAPLPNKAHASSTSNFYFFFLATNLFHLRLFIFRAEWVLYTTPIIIIILIMLSEMCGYFHNTHTHTQHTSWCIRTSIVDISCLRCVCCWHTERVTMEFYV